MTSGVRLRPAEQVLVSRARDFLAAGPSDAVDLIAHVCQLPSPPRFVADHMAMALLGAWEEFGRDAEGRWCLVANGSTGSWAGGDDGADVLGAERPTRAASGRTPG